MSTLVSQREYDVFLLHSGVDNAIVAEIAMRLEKEANLHPFLTEWYLKPGDEWHSALEQAVDGSKTLAVFFGELGIWYDRPGSIDRELVYRARQSNKRIIPVRLPGGKMPYDDGFLSLRTWVDLEHDDGFARLVVGIAGQEPRSDANHDGAVDPRLVEFVDELARVLSDREDADAMLYRAGVPSARLPLFDDPVIFWNRVITQARDEHPGGVQAIAVEVAKEYPANPVFSSFIKFTMAATSFTEETRSDEESANDSRAKLAKEFARRFGDPDEATMILWRAGFPKEHIPPFRTPITFWTRAIRDATNGRNLGGVRALVAEAANHRPDAVAFERFLQLTPDETSNSGESGGELMEIDALPVDPRLDDSEHSQQNTPKGEDIMGDAARVGTGIRMQRKVEDADLGISVSEIAKAIAEVLQDADGELCFALYGPWGRGKTTLAHLICDRLAAPGDPTKPERPRYRTVWFNAWKYRSPPEIWAHLYESLALAATSERAFSRPARAIRSNISRLGLWPLTLALSLFAVALMPFSSKLEGAIWLFMQLVSALGFFGAVWIIFAFRNTAGVVNRVWKLYGVLPSHRDKLGLQAAIGDDLRHLLRGWVWDPFIRPGREERTLDRDLLRSIKATPERAAILSFAISVYLVGLVLLFVLGTLSNPQPILYFTVPELWIVLTFFVGRWVLHSGDATNRVMLVVDDLDRCPPDLMLEILESIKLMVEDPDVCERLQVMVLVDDEMLFRAAMSRFESHTYHVPEDDRNDVRRRLVREHLDKVFLADFRLGRLSEHDVAELVRKLAPATPRASTSAGKSTGSEVESRGVVQAGESSSGAGRAVANPSMTTGGGTLGPAVSTPEGPIEVKAIKAIAAEASNDSPRQISVNLFDGTEQDILINECKDLLKDDDPGRRIGPRAIKSVVLRYQLARLILTKLEIPVDPQIIARSIVLAARADRKVKLESGSSSARQVEAVIDQVAGINTFGIDR